MSGDQKIKITGSDARLVRNGVERLHSHVADVFRMVQAATGIVSPTGSLNVFFGLLANLRKFLEDVDFSSAAYVPEGLEPIFRTVVQYHRRERARANERSRSVVISVELSDILASEIKPLDRLIEDPVFSAVVPLLVPRLTDFVTIQKATELQSEAREPEPSYEGKFNVLLAPGTIPFIMEYHRRQCEQRGLSMSVVFLDIDDFKRFNTKYGEPKVDRELLPGFMNLIQKSVFGRGRAFLHGGDECLLLMPNADLAFVLFVLSRLNLDLAGLRFAGMEGTITISCGVCTLEPDAFLTDAEVLDHAARAKKRGKDAGKNCIAAYHGGGFRDDDLAIYEPGGQIRSKKQ
jgi:diguanylate cyclase (GGDEF)-like protein